MVRETTVADIRWVCANMRAVDAEEQFATRFPGDDTPDALARDMIARMPMAICSFTFGLENAGAPFEPVCILSGYLVSPGVAKLHRISTDQWPTVAREVFRFGIERFMPAVGAAAHLAECSILYQHNLARQILGKLGFQLRCNTLRGRNREAFADYAWVKPNV